MTHLYTFCSHLPIQVSLASGFTFTRFMNYLVPYLTGGPSRSQCAICNFVGVVWIGKQ